MPHLELWLVSVDVVGQDGSLIFKGTVIGPDHTHCERGTQETNGPRQGSL